MDASEESFLSVIRASLSRGLTLDRAFAHFDVLGVGAVTPDQFMEGLRVRGGRLVLPCLLLLRSPLCTSVCTSLIASTMLSPGLMVTGPACLAALCCVLWCVRCVVLQLLGINIHELAMRILVARVPLDRGGLIGLPQFEIFCEPALREAGDKLKPVAEEVAGD